MGRHGQGERNKLYLDLHHKTKLVVANTFFKKKDTRYWTWESPDGRTRNQIDFIMSSQRRIRESGWCSGYSPCLAPMGPVGPGFDSRYGLYVQMVSQSMLALAGFLRDLRFPPTFKIGMCLERSKHPFTQDVWGAAVLKVDVTI